MQKTFRHMWCTEIAANSPHGFLDNGWYVGHDEPDLGFFSRRPGSARALKTSLVVAARAMREIYSYMGIYVK